MHESASISSGSDSEEAENGYNAGGGGYILSNAAVRLFVQHLYHNENLCPYDWAEDRGMGRCLASLDITPQDTRDEHGMHRFIPFHTKEIAEIYSGYHYYPFPVKYQFYFVKVHITAPNLAAKYETFRSNALSETRKA
uniref:N-acetylgalactosaminide beta-1,3-galactosyltransferase n=1 Tax=Caenorhabditis japonica TaxID=281687 RepID=A0A8R1HTX3_CAEJA